MECADDYGESYQRIVQIYSHAHAHAYAYAHIHIFSSYLSHSISIVLLLRLCFIYPKFCLLSPSLCFGWRYGGLQRF